MEKKPKFVSRLEIRKLLHDAHWQFEPVREDVIDAFIMALIQNELPDVENFKVTIVEVKPGES